MPVEEKQLIFKPCLFLFKVLVLVNFLWVPSVSAFFDPYFTAGGVYYYEQGGPGSTKLAPSYPWELSFYAGAGFAYSRFDFSYRLFNELSVFGFGPAGFSTTHHEFKSGYSIIAARDFALCPKAGVILDRPVHYIGGETSGIFFEPAVDIDLFYQPTSIFGVVFTLGGLRRVKPLPDWVGYGAFFFRSYSVSFSAKNCLVVFPFLTCDFKPHIMWDARAKPVLAPSPGRSTYPNCFFYGFDLGFSVYPSRFGF